MNNVYKEIFNCKKIRRQALFNSTIINIIFDYKYKFNIVSIKNLLNREHTIDNILIYSIIIYKCKFNNFK